MTGTHTGRRARRWRREEVDTDPKIVFGFGAAALALSASVGTGSGFADAAPVPVPFSGAMTCSLAGSYIFNPGLDNAGSAQSTVTVKAKLTSCHGVGAINGTASIVSGHLVATSATTIANIWGGASPVVRPCRC